MKSIILNSTMPMAAAAAAAAADGGLPPSGPSGSNTALSDKSFDMVADLFRYPVNTRSYGVASF